MLPRPVRLLVVLALPGCVLAAPFDSALMSGPDAGMGPSELPPVSERQIAPIEGADGGSGVDAGEPSGSGADADAGVPEAMEEGPCTLGETRSCYPGAAGEAGTGICRAGTQACVSDDGALGWGACDGARTASAEECGNGLDEDCDGETDEGCAEVEVRWCWFCSGIDLLTENGACALGSVPANDDGSCPAGTSLDVPECEPCLTCTIIQSFCESPECCGEWADTQTHPEGCSCWGCPGEGRGGDVDTAVAHAEDAGLAFCSAMPAQYDSACGGASNGCYVRSCGTAASCR